MKLKSRAHLLLANTQNIDFVSSNNTDSTNESVSVVPKVFAASSKALVSTFPNVDNLSDAVIYSFFASQSNSLQLDNEDLKQIDVDDLEEMDLKWQMAMLTMRAMRFLQKTEMNLGANGTTGMQITRDNKNKDTPRRTIPVEVSTSNALVSHCDGAGSYDWSFQADEEPSNYALMAFTSSGSSSSPGSDNEIAHCSESDDSVPTSLVNDRYNSGEGYHAVPPPYTGTFMPHKPDLVFHDAPPASETVPNVVHVESSTNKTSKEMSKSLRPDAPIIEDWTSDFEDESEPKASVETVEHPKQAENLRINNQKSRGHQHSWNIKACFICKSLNHLIKDCDYYEKQMVQKPVWNHAMRMDHHSFARMSHPHRHIVPTAVLTRSRLVPLNAARPVTTAVPKSTIKSPKPVKHVVNKAHSSIRRLITHRPAPKTSNFHKKVTTVKVSTVNGVKGTKETWIQISHGLGPQKTLSFLFDVQGNPHQALKDKGYVTFGRNPKGGKITDKGKIKTGKLDFDDVYFVKELKFNLFSVSQMFLRENNMYNVNFKLPDENHVLLRFPKENNMYNVDLKNVVPLGDLTCLYANVTLDESNLWYKMLGHINFKTMNKLVKGNLVRGLPSKVFENNHTCVACKKGKQLRASCKFKPVSSISHPLQRMKKIKREFSVARTPQQNGVAERKNRTLIEAARTMLADLLLPISFWAEAVNTVYPLGKFDGKADEGFLVRYSVNSNAFRVFNSRTRVVQETLHINFLENQPNIVGSGPKWMFDIDTLTQSMNYQPVVAGNQPNHSACIKETLDAGKVGKETEFAQQYVLLPLWSIDSQYPQNTYADVAFDVKENETEVHVSPSESNKTKKHDEKDKREAKGKSPVDLSTGFRDLRDEFEEFSINSTNRVNDASAPVTVVGPNPTNITNSFNANSPSDNVVSLNFKIGGKSSFMDPSQYPDDLDMPALEDIVYSADEEDAGSEADFSNLKTNISFSPIPTTRGHTKEEGIDYEEVFAPVARIEAIRLFLAYASFMGFMVYQMDVKSAFLYGTIEEEVYVCQPLGFEDPDYPDKVYKAVKALYGLRQAPRAWYETLANYLLENGFQRGKIDQTLFIKKQKGDILLVQVYVDDIIFGYTNKELCKAFEKLMMDKFQMSSMGELTFFRITNSKSASTPIDTEKPLLKDPDSKDVDVHIYRYQVTLKVLHLHAVKRIFRYLKGKPHLGLWYPKDFPFNLVAYSDSDYAGASLDRKSITGGCQFLGCRLISWQCKKHTVVATSSTEAEYVAAASCCAQVLWIQNQLLDYGKNVVVTEDVIHQDLRLDDADGVECRKFNFSKYIFDNMVRNVDSPSKFLMYPRFLQVLINNQVDDFSSHTTRYTSPALIQKVFANMRKIGKGFSGIETPLFATMLVQPQGRIETKDYDNIAAKEVNAVEPTMFDDEEVTMTMAQTLIKMKAKKARILDEHDRFIISTSMNTKKKRRFEGGSACTSEIVKDFDRAVTPSTGPEIEQLAVNDELGFVIHHEFGYINLRLCEDHFTV
nr:putative ribonuclease H-like domain-containing protein [Tanacetum cinerariifolium]